MNSSVQHTDVGAYALGLLEEPDRRAFEAHLARCSSCAAELAEFRGMRDLFAGLTIDDVEGTPAAPAGSYADPGPSYAEPAEPPGRVIDMMRHKRAREKRRRQANTLLSAAAAISLIAGGVAVGSVVLDNGKETSQGGSPGSAAELLKTGERHSAADKTSGAVGTVALDGSKDWGTQVALDLAKVHGPLECQLIAVSKSGGERVVGGWSVPDKGYGVPEHPKHLTVLGGVSTPKSEITRFDVRTTSGKNLLSIPV